MPHNQRGQNRDGIQPIHGSGKEMEPSCKNDFRASLRALLRVWAEEKSKYSPFEWEVLFHSIPDEVESIFFLSGKNISQPKGNSWEIPMN
jgi:hypothetical protein